MRPSLFDLGLYLFTFLCPIFFLMPWDLNMARGWFFVFGTLALLGLSFFCKKEVEYNNKILGFIILWSLMNVFIHSFSNRLAQGIQAQFINFCLLSEGFIYVLCGCLLFYLAVSYKKNFNLAYPIYLINILNVFFAITQKQGLHLIWSRNPSISGFMGTCSQLTVFSAISVPLLAKLNWKLAILPLICIILSNSYTGALALGLVGLFYYGYKRLWVQFFGVSSSIAVFIYCYHNTIWLKFLIRMELWGIALKEIIAKPVFGFGFDNSLTFNMVKSKLNGGFTYRHNDFLNITRDLGVIFAGVLLFGLFRILKKQNKDYLWCAVVIGLVSCFWQTNAYFACISGIGIILLALLEQKKCKIQTGR